MTDSDHNRVPSDPIPETGDLADAFKAFSDTNRLRIISLLASDRSGSLGVSDLASILGITQPAVSQHLKVLKNEGIVESERMGFHVNLAFNQERMAQIGIWFNQLLASIENRCDQQLMRDQKMQTMNVVFICFSYSGITRTLFERIHAVCGGDMIEVATLKKYRTFTAYTTGCLRSRKEEPDPISPASLDVSGYDLIVIGTPVWAWKPAPAIHAAVMGLSGCEGKKVVMAATYCNNPGECLPILQRWLEEKGMRVISRTGFSKPEAEDPVCRNNFMQQIIEAYRA
jgi:DNA-binding transcriptional ArsR family regulator